MSYIFMKLITALKCCYNHLAENGLFLFQVSQLLLKIIIFFFLINHAQF